jgi:hypothetical protein
VATSSSDARFKVRLCAVGCPACVLLTFKAHMHSQGYHSGQRTATECSSAISVLFRYGFDIDQEKLLRPSRNALTFCLTTRRGAGFLGGNTPRY